MGGYTDEEEHLYRESILNVLKKVGATEREITECLRDWHQLTIFDYAYFILGGPHAPGDGRPEMTKSWESWKALRNGGLPRVASPGEIREFLVKYGFMTTDLDGYIKDYEFYLEHREHRRPEIWKNRKSWGYLGQQK